MKKRVYTIRLAIADITLIQQTLRNSGGSVYGMQFPPAPEVRAASRNIQRQVLAQNAKHKITRTPKR